MEGEAAKLALKVWQASSIASWNAAISYICTMHTHHTKTCPQTLRTESHKGPTLYILRDLLGIWYLDHLQVQLNPLHAAQTVQINSRSSESRKLLMCPACALLKAKKSSGKAQLPSDQHISGEPIGPRPGAWDELIQKPKKVGVCDAVNVETLATDYA